MHFRSPSTYMNFLSRFYFLTSMDWEILAVFECKQKRAITLKSIRPRPPKLVSMHFRSTSIYMNFLSRFYFLTPMVRREILAVFECKQKGAITPKSERSRPPKLFSMHFKLTSTYMNFLSQFYFLSPMDYSPWFEGKFWQFLNASKKEP